MFEKEGIKYAIEETVGTECLSKPVEDFHFIDLAESQQEKAQCFKDGAEFGYNKANEILKSAVKVLISTLDDTLWDEGHPGYSDSEPGYNCPECACKECYRVSCKYNKSELFKQLNTDFPELFKKESNYV